MGRVCPLAGSFWLCDNRLVPITVVVVDDHAGFRRAASALLELEGFDVVGEARDGSSAVAVTRELRPQLVLLDVALPDASGFDIARRVVNYHSKVILTSSREHGDLGRRVRESGALGFVPKDELSGAALRALLDQR
jgi:DNA-binding NarL/FixJ family response regulator